MGLLHQAENAVRLPTQSSSCLERGWCEQQELMLAGTFQRTGQKQRSEEGHQLPFASSTRCEGPSEGHPCTRTAWPSSTSASTQNTFQALGLALSLALEKQVAVRAPISTAAGWITMFYHRQPFRQQYTEAQSAIKGDFFPTFPLDQCVQQAHLGLIQVSVGASGQLLLGI